MYYVSTEKRELVSIEELSNDIANLVKSNILNSCYPIGSIYMSMDSTSPSTLFGGTWDQLDEGKVLIGCNETYPAGSTGGEFTHTLTEAEMPPHTHSYQRNARSSRAESSGVRPAGYSVNSGVSNYTTTSTGSGTAFDLMQPYLAVYMWQRIS